MKNPFMVQYRPDGHPHIGWYILRIFLWGSIGGLAGLLIHPLVAVVLAYLGLWLPISWDIAETMSQYG